ncbi:hypothetical protein KAFR_0E00310 [Kazachstania africana CBS 2517]|uniref:Serine/threonine-protein kinase TOR n=1 Tax=Kazachstania africana (strain ATCC 22294 / BCRC 22015 / CBS 2517 / CECT 1963 / NBRC 1671 / NRRL Y-8276) TaxID=1071382 RepID=H2AUY5_KAZAF|nr:hypothetical protein KAFR_0E00310 [Kazachstania africana CBS 2517]CCF58185.1 hypothetical protein KAFR_0E00310 [Kazachstania africana CBS 2517]
MTQPTKSSLVLSLRRKMENRTSNAGKKLSSSHSTSDLVSTKPHRSVSTRKIPRKTATNPVASVFNEPENKISDIDTTHFTFNIIFDKLKSSNSQERTNATIELKNSLISLNRELSSEQFQRLSNSINNKIFELIHGSTSEEKIGGVLAVDTLISFYSHTEELPSQTSRLANYLRMLIPSSDIEVMRQAATTLGKLAIPGGTLTSEFVEVEVKNAMEWLTSSPENNASSKQEFRKHAALLVLSALADNSSYLLYPYVNLILENVWRALRDTKVVIRVDASRMLGKCLKVIKDRNNNNENEQWVKRLFNESLHGLTLNTNEALHASLLVFRELLRLENDKFIKGKISHIFKNCMALKDHKFEVVRLEVYNILPLLASFDKESFIKLYLDQIMLHYLNVFKTLKSNSTNGSDKPLIFVSIGDIAFEVGHSISPYMNQILDNIRDGLRTKYKMRRNFEREVFYCIEKLAYALGPALAKHLNRDLLNLLFSCTLSDYMQKTSMVLAEKVPALEKTINNRLLNLLCITLYGESCTGRELPSLMKPASLERARDWRNRSCYKKTTEANDETRDVQLLIQSLRMLQSIKNEYSLANFVQFVVMAYIEHDNASVRKVAALTSCDLISRDAICKQSTLSALQSVSQILSKLLILVITDTTVENRLEILQHLTSNFDPQLAQPDNIRLLFTALHDEMFTIQMEAMKLISRVSSVNPAYIVPSLRKTLMELLTQIKHVTASRKKEECIILLQLLINSSKDVTEPYMDRILDVLLDKTKDSSSNVAYTSLKAIGELAVVGGSDIKKHLDKLMPLIISTFQNQSNSFKRNAALKTLGQIAGSTGYVIDPLLDYPELLGILMNILKFEQSIDTKKEIIRLVGILGALDPYKHRVIEAKNPARELLDQNAPSIDIALLLKGITPSNEEYYPTVAIHSLVKILHDASLSSHHTAAVQTISQIFQIVGNQCISLLDIIIPGILHVMTSCPPSILEFYFQQLRTLIGVAKEHVMPFVDEIYEVVEEFFTIVNLQINIILLIETISTSIKNAFKKYIPITINMFLGVLENDESPKKLTSTRILKSLITFGANLEDDAYAVVPMLVKMCEYSSGSLRKTSIVVLGRLAKSVDLSEMSSRIVQTLLRIMNTGDKDLTKALMNTFSLLLLQMGSDFMVFVPIINKALVKNRIQNSIYDQLVNKLINNERLPTNIILDREAEEETNPAFENFEAVKPLFVNQLVLRNVLHCSAQHSQEDWKEWLRRLSIQLLKESPSHALRACSNLGSIYYPLARDLFNASFASCWKELSDASQTHAVNSLCLALASPENPPEIYQTILGLVEFMEHGKKPLPIPTEILGQYAQKCHAYAKALHYKELEFLQNPSSSAIESLININNQLHQTDASIGILKYAQQHHKLQLKETWYEKLQRWEDALQAYEEREKSGDTSNEVLLGKMRSLHALGEWDPLSKLATEKWQLVDPDARKSIAPLAAGAAWGLGQWDNIEQYIDVMNPSSPDRNFFEAILCLHRNNFMKAEEHISNARNSLVTEMSALVSESYTRAYSVVVRSQMIAELEEVMNYKQLPFNSTRHKAITATWNKRLLGAQRNVDVWRQILSVRSLVVKPQQDSEIWIEFANLCRKSNRMGLAKRSLSFLMETENDPNMPNIAYAAPQVVYAHLKYLWASGLQKEALKYLTKLSLKLVNNLGLDPDKIINQNTWKKDGLPKDSLETEHKLLARCFLKQGEWQVILQPDWREKKPDAVLGSYLLAAHFDSSSYKAWHKWALANFEVISVLTASPSDDKNGPTSTMHKTNNGMIGLNTFETRRNSFSNKIIHKHVVPAIKAFFHSIALSETSSLQDALRLLTLWFSFGGIPEATQAVHEGFALIKISTWLEVLPQLISRIHQRDEIVSKSLLTLLSELGKAHPQALVYPLTVAIKSESISRQKAALSIMNRMRTHSPLLVEQAELVSHELIRVAVLWHELWYEGLENASRQFFGENNTDKMFEILEPLHQMLDKGPETIREISFKNFFGRDLNDAYRWVVKYKANGDRNNLNQAWDIYYAVFRRISKDLPQLQTLELQHVSPKLLEARDLDLAVPGKYHAYRQLVKISSFDPVFSVIASKQRPRKISIKGSDGKEYTYALKGHEDIRQDSLVMQLFGLVNTLLQNDPESFRRHLDIQQYPAIPLSPKTGLLGWVTKSDTFHDLIKNYRDTNKIPLNIEHWIMLQMAPDYDSLTLLEKIEVFQYAMENTKGQDLANVLWLKSKSSETWLERRTIYTKSLAVMSMTGYILGLGDRHPSNFLLNKYTGKVVHIDFGDCFEAALLREKFPERVPFRLTRMLTNAMEVGGVEGSFRISCENVMRVLRDNKESVMAILEAFAFDPLIHWGFDISIETIEEITGIDLSIDNPHNLLRRGAITDEEAVKLESDQRDDIRNARALLVLTRITEKLTGNDFGNARELDVPEQVDKLIQQAVSVKNLCQHYIGWCPFW